MSRIDTPNLARMIGACGSWKDGVRVVVLPEVLVHEIHDELVRLERLEEALVRLAANEAEIGLLLAKGRAT